MQVSVADLESAVVIFGDVGEKLGDGWMKGGCEGQMDGWMDG